MTQTNAEVPEPKLASIPEAGGWEITYHRLFLVSPGDADRVPLDKEGFTIWDLCFQEDLLQAINLGQGLLLDVGWYPGNDPTGEYWLRLIRVRNRGRNGPDSYDWQNPIVTFCTRSLGELLGKVQETFNS